MSIRNHLNRNPNRRSSGKTARKGELDLHVNQEDRETVYVDGHYSISLATENGARLVEEGYRWGFGLIAYQSESEAIQAATAWDEYAGGI